LVIKTDDVTLTYSGGGRLSKDNLSVRFTLNGEEKVWRPGDAEDGNLLGTLRTLDGCKGFSQVCYPNKGDRYDKGVISRDGWAIIDESQRHLFQANDSDWGAWVAERPEGDRQDMYIFAYGHDYKSALNDYTKVAGKVPLPPKYMFGYWWSHYWQYSDFEFVDLAKKMRSLDVPIDVMVIDMDWHDTYTLTRFNAVRDEFWQKKGWTGYTWNTDLIPDYKELLSHLNSEGLEVTLNVHPAEGVAAHESMYPEMARSMGKVIEKEEKVLFEI
jgi:alpha-glucosidase